MTRTQLRRAVRQRIAAHGDSYRGFLRSIGLDECHTTKLVRFVRDGKAPEPAMLKALGYRRVEPPEHYEASELQRPKGR